MENFNIVIDTNDFNATLHPRSQISNRSTTLHNMNSGPRVLKAKRRVLSDKTELPCRKAQDKEWTDGLGQ